MLFLRVGLNIVENPTAVFVQLQYLQDLFDNRILFFGVELCFFLIPTYMLVVRLVIF